MPLPSALAARLAKRGLIFKRDSEEKPNENGDNTRNQIANPPEIEEEVIAENYDDQENQVNALNRLNSKAKDDSEEEIVDDDFDDSKKYLGHPGCPNKYNVFHECSTFCKDHWKEGHKEPDPKYLRKKVAMLKKYPLPSHWKEIYDPGTGRHYYWETDSDSVSWLPPSHPKAIISESAAYLREEQNSGTVKKDLVDDDDDLEDKDLKSDYSSEDESDEELRRREEKKRRRENEEKKRSRGRVKTRENDLDPMDPASYSNIPRGGWSEGLSKGNEAKTGADVTASGPLYQMRPYPNPGAVLRANARGKKRTPDADENGSDVDSNDSA